MDPFNNDYNFIPEFNIDPPELPEIPNIDLPDFDDVGPGRFNESIQQKIDLEFDSYSEQKTKEDKMNDIIIKNQCLNLKIEKLKKILENKENDLKQQRILVSYFRSVSQSLLLVLKSIK